MTDQIPKASLFDNEKPDNEEQPQTPCVPAAPAAPAQAPAPLVRPRTLDDYVGDEPQLDIPLLEPTLVSVRMFEKEYQIRSDKPDLVKVLARQIDKNAKKIREENPSLGPGQFAWPVQVAFSLCLDHYKTKKELRELRNAIENKSVDLASKIEDQLREIEDSLAD